MQKTRYRLAVSGASLPIDATCKHGVKMWNDTDIPLAYFISFRAYGTWLHGDKRGSIDRFNNRYRSPYIPRQLRQDGLWLYSFTPWADKGSKRRLWNERSVAKAIDYVLNGQGNDLPDFDY